MRGQQLTCRLQGGSWDSQHGSPRPQVNCTTSGKTPMSSPQETSMSLFSVKRRRRKIAVELVHSREAECALSKRAFRMQEQANFSSRWWPHGRSPARITSCCEWACQSMSWPHSKRVWGLETGEPFVFYHVRLAGFGSKPIGVPFTVGRRSRQLWVQPGARSSSACWGRALTQLQWTLAGARYRFGEVLSLSWCPRSRRSRRTSRDLHACLGEE